MVALDSQALIRWLFHLTHPTSDITSQWTSRCGDAVLSSDGLCKLCSGQGDQSHYYNANKVVSCRSVTLLEC